MSDLNVILRRREPASLEMLRFHPTVRIEQRGGFAVAHLSVRKGQRALLARRLAEYPRVDLPASQHHAAGVGLTVLGLTSTHFLVIAEGAGSGWVWDLSRTLTDCCAVSDQTGAFMVLRLSGPGVRSLLAAGLFIDLADSAFPVGRVAAGLLSHFNVIVWRSARDFVFNLAVPRSFARDLVRWLSERGPMVNP